jgi:hypothetical protein
VLQSHGVKACYDRYLTWFANEEATEKQKQRSTAYLRSCAEAKMRNDTGSRFAAFAIWEIGIPNMSETLATTLPDVARSADAAQNNSNRDLPSQKKTMGANPKYKMWERQKAEVPSMLQSSNSAIESDRRKHSKRDANASLNIGLQARGMAHIAQRTHGHSLIIEKES